MTQTLERAVEQLQALPVEEQDRLAAQILDHVKAYEALRLAVAEGAREVAEGQTVPLDAEDVIRRGYERQAARSSR